MVPPVPVLPVDIKSRPGLVCARFIYRVIVPKRPAKSLGTLIASR